MTARHDRLGCLPAVRVTTDVLASSLAAEKRDRRRLLAPLFDDTHANVVPKIANATRMNPRTTASPPLMIPSFCVQRVP
jgi:hypothetical protein